jgi:hypothetical protein
MPLLPPDCHWILGAGIGEVSVLAKIQPEAVNQARLAFMPVYAKLVATTPL